MHNTALFMFRFYFKQKALEKSSFKLTAKLSRKEKYFTSAVLPQRCIFPEDAQHPPRIHFSISSHGPQPLTASPSTAARLLCLMSLYLLFVCQSPWFMSQLSQHCKPYIFCFISLTCLAKGLYLVEPGTGH